MISASLSILPASSLVTPRRLDLAVKWRFFRHLDGGADEDSESVYRWHIAARHAEGFVDAEKLKHTADSTLDNYVNSAIALYMSMSATGFNPQYAIPVDPNREILGGAHRLSCAVALKKSVCVTRHGECVWAPAWDLEWFEDNGMSEPDLQRLVDDWEKMFGPNE